MDTPDHSLTFAAWNEDAITAAASRIGVDDLTSHLGAPLPPAPTIATMSLLVRRLPIAFADLLLLAPAPSDAGGTLTAMENQPRCEFRADVIYPRGRALTRARDVQCMNDRGHERDAGDAEHEFYVDGAHTFGVSWEGKRWVSR